MTRRLRLDIAYDGTDYAGWQRQPGEPTVQGLLEQALFRLNGDRPTIVRGAGRTDAGVHAHQQVADFDYHGPLSDRDLAHALHRMLPDAVRPVRLWTVDREFSSRLHAVSKRYVYRLDRSKFGSPTHLRYAAHWPHAFDATLAQQALDRLIGRRDWTGFTAASCTIDNRVRTISEARWEAAAQRFVFAADGFLTYMVRNMVGTVLCIAAQRWAAERVDEILHSGDRTLAGPTAPARGLCLDAVSYAAPYDSPLVD